MTDASPTRSRFLTLLGILAVAIGIWGGYFTEIAYQAFDQMVQRSGPRGGPYTEGPREPIEPWVLSYCGLSAFLMLAAGTGLILRRRWAPATAGFAGIAWTVVSFGFAVGQIRILRGYSITPASGRAELTLYAGGALVTLAAGLAALSCLLREPVRAECRTAFPGWPVCLALLLWTGVTCVLARLWLNWYFGIWGMRPW